ncbi:MAG: AsmA family protein [Gammaproteobacteria bacterium]|nr:AsmA family protein [Gammaproteobacteria bacterium]
MKIVLRLVLGLGLVALLIVSAGGVYLATFDPNAHKALIVEKVKAATGRELTLVGPIELSVWPKLHLQLGALKLSNAAGFGETPFLVVQEFEIAVATWPLLRRRIEINTARILGAELHLAKDAAGKTNWADLADSGKEPQDQREGGSPIAALILGGVDVRDAEVTWVDDSDARELILSALTIQSGPLVFGDPVTLTLAADVTATKPALAGAIKLASTLTYDTKAEHYTIKPFTFETDLQGKTLPGGKAELRAVAALDLDLAAGIAKISELKFDGLGNTVGGELILDHLQAAHPGAHGTFQLKGKDLAILFKAFALPAANQVATLKDRSFELNTSFDANMDTGVLAVPTLDARFLGATVSGELNGTKINTDLPTLHGKLGAVALDLPNLLVVLNQFLGGDAKAGQSLLQALTGVKARSFTLNSEFNVDLGEGRLDLPSFTASILGNEIHGAVTSSKATAGKPALKGELNAKGPDLTALVMTAAALQGLESNGLVALTKVLGKRQDKNFSFNTTLEADLNEDRVALPTLSANLFGNQLKGTFKATRATSGTPAVSGNFAAEGPDLPALLALVGSFQGAESGLVTLAASLARAADKTFSFNTQFDADLKEGRAEIATLKAQSMGLNLEGQFKATALNRPTGGAVDGHLLMQGRDLKSLLNALEQPDLAQSIQAIAIDAGIKGEATALSLSPFAASAQIAGVAGGKPVELRLSTGAVSANLAQETLSLKDLSLTGLGINLKGALEATKIKTAPTYTGLLTLARFDLREVLAKLNKPVTGMSDPTTLRAVGLTTAIKGTNQGVGFSGLQLVVDDTTLKGAIEIKSFTGPDLEFDLNADALNADRYLAAKTPGGTAPVTPEAAAVGASTLPLETLRKLKLKGRFKIAHLQISGAKLGNLALAVAARDGLLALNPVTADLYQGRYQGAVSLNATGKQPQLALKTTLAKVEVEPLLVDLNGTSDLAGTLNFEATLEATGGDARRIKRTLSGPASFAVHNGVVRGVDVPAVLKAAELVIESRGLTALPKGGSTKFQSLTGSLAIDKGVISNRDLLLDGLGFKITGEGMLARLSDMTIKYDSRIAVDEGAVEKGAQHYKLGGYAIPVRCRGEISGTSCLPDFGALAKQAAVKVASDKVKKKVDESLGGAGKALKNLLKF